MPQESLIVKSAQINPVAEKRIKEGHYWIFNNEILEKITDLPKGGLVQVSDDKGKILGTGYSNPHSLITIRMLSWHKEEEINEDFFLNRIKSALERRKQIYPAESNYRLIYSESDGLPGLIVDRYNDVLVAQIQTAGMEALFPMIGALLIRTLNPQGIFLKNDGQYRKLEGLGEEEKIWFGHLPEDLIVERHGLKLRVNLRSGQKTGLFYDQMENLQLVREGIANKRVLDVFCYLGAWSFTAAAYGAKSVLGIDRSKEALLLSRESKTLNLHGEVCEFVEGDAFELMRKLSQEGQMFDCVILDPPAFAKTKRDVPQAIKAYRDINRWALKLLNAGGRLITCSCSYHLTLSKFMEIIYQAAVSTGKRLYVEEIRGQARDHPMLLAMPETAYLKCVVLKII